jgi:DNA-binding response OmpR family regulator
MRQNDRSSWDLKSATAQARERHKPLVPRSRSPVVLLVEDDDEMRSMLASALRRDGCRVIESMDGEDALDWLGVGALQGELLRAPALIVSDIRLPSVSGFDILAGVSLAPRHVPVILITGFGDAEAHARARELGAECVLDKPFAMREFREAVATTLGRRDRLLPLDGDGHVA